MTTIASDKATDPAAELVVLKKQKLGRKAKYDRMWGLFFISPWILGILLWYLVPMVASLLFSFYDFDLVRPEEARFIGLGNYIKLFSDPLVYESLWVTVKFALIAIPSALALPLAFAWLLTSKSLRGKALFRTFFFLPTIVPFVSVVFIWNGFLNTQTGWLNRFLGAIGLPGPDWLNSTFWIYPALAMIGFWGVGNAMLLFIASIQGIPNELFEAADVDGANSWHKFLHISIPIISPIIFYNLVLLMIAIFNYFLVPFVLKNGTGDPANATLFYSLYFFKTAFTFNDMGYGATLAWVLFLIILALTVLLFGTARYWVHYEYEEA